MIPTRLGPGPLPAAALSRAATYNRRQPGGIMTNKPRSWLEKGRSIPVPSQFVAAEFVERQRSGSASCDQVTNKRAVTIAS